MAGFVPTNILVLLTFILGHVTSARAASNSTQCPSDPYQDPSNDPCNALGYIANNTLTAVAFGFVLLIALIQTYQIIYNGAKWMLVMVIGEYMYALGFGFRFALHANPDSLGIYIAEYLFIVLSPCFFIAANYVFLGRLARDLDCTHHVLFLRRLTLIFVLSDVSTFVIQAVGASMTTSSDYNSALTGRHIFLAGLVLQFVSLFSFCVVYGRFLFKVHAQEQAVWTRDSEKRWSSDWRSVAAALAISCICILIRSCYRVVEIAQGAGGSLAASETAFYVGDTLPLCVAIFVFVPFWPGRFVPNKRASFDSNKLQGGLELSGSPSPVV
ncbi:hypothetical protein AZE42_00341 [Rhizopogon vesiculosus]|uniref:RTA1-domain-containing protein n=1 Tax=Rhizopogon vesiculosus TaxID=180088 RepID=A0A1J8QEA8_9AGAM|nr:hypothetical protein AZE42_00341 [Rhizopogon vesiculosus]